MNLRASLASLLFFISSLFFLNCVSTEEGVAQNAAQANYYDPDSPDNNAAYFTKLRDYFTEIRFSCTDDELHRYTATRYIASQPPGAQVYVDNKFMGLTNDRDLYFKPGQYVVTFYKLGTQWTEILVFAQGKNATVVVKPQN